MQSKGDVAKGRGAVLGLAYSSQPKGALGPGSPPGVLWYRPVNNVGLLFVRRLVGKEETDE